MSIPVRFEDGSGSERAAIVTPTGAVAINEQPFPPVGASQFMRVYRQFLTDDGTSSGSSDMRVDGSSTNVDFWVQPGSDNDLYISTLSFVISDAAATLNSFGTLSALTNGCRLFYEDERGQVVIHQALQTNFHFVRLCQGQPAFGDAGTAFRANNISGTSEGFIPSLNIREVFGFRWGLRLRAGTVQKIALTVRDDTTSVDSFNCIAYGFERLPE